TMLFSGSGYFKKLYNTRNIYKFKRPRERPKVLNFSVITGFSSLMGMPFLLGFNSKHLIKAGFLSENILSLKTIMPDWLVSILKIKIFSYLHFLGNEYFLQFILYAGSLLTGLYSIRFLYWVILKNIMNKRSEEVKENHNPIPQVEDKGTSIILVVLAFSLVLISLYCGDIINYLMGSNFHGHYDLLSGSVEFLSIIILSLIILSRFNWLKTKAESIPSLDKAFSNINKAFFDGSRYLYNIIYQEFQYQLLWIPVFFIILFLWIFV
ncbi:MAG: hypothetical protein ACOCQN_04570, partial [Halanaerobiaceae bacterium]